VCSPSTSYGAALLGPIGWSIGEVRRGSASDGISALHSTKRSIIGWNCDSKRNALGGGSSRSSRSSGSSSSSSSSSNNSNNRSGCKER
jgi:hypothetical protein